MRRGKRIRKRGVGEGEKNCNAWMNVQGISMVDRGSSDGNG